MDFTGLERGATDIDGLSDYKGQGFLFYELKHRDAECPDGQRKALQNFVDTAHDAGKLGLALIAEHFVEDTTKDVLVKDCFVREMYYSEERKWRPPREVVTVGQMEHAFNEICRRREERKCGTYARLLSATEHQAE